MPSNKDKPKKIQSEFVSKASEELEDAVASELEVEDPSVEEAAAIIEELSVEISVVEEAEEACCALRAIGGRERPRRLAFSTNKAGSNPALDILRHSLPPISGTHFSVHLPAATVTR